MRSNLCTISRQKKLVFGAKTLQNKRHHSPKNSNGKLNLSRMESLVREISDLNNRGKEIVLVSSGAIAAGMGKLNLTERPRTSFQIFSSFLILFR